MKRCCIVLSFGSVRRIRNGVLAALAAFAPALLPAQGGRGGRGASEQPPVTSTPPQTEPGPPGGDLQFLNVTVKELILRAYRIAPSQLRGPAWLTTSRLDLAGQAPSGASQNQIAPVLQDFLAEEFKLEVRRQRRVMNVYGMEAAEGGPKLDQTPTWDHRPGECEGKKHRALAGRPAKADLICRGTSMAGLAWLLESQYFATGLNIRPVIDRTGLPGVYDFEMDLPSLNLAVASPGSSNLSLAAAPPLLAAAPPLNDMRRQLEPLGLTIVERKEAVDVFQVVRCERPPSGKKFAWPIPTN